MGHPCPRGADDQIVDFPEIFALPVDYSKADRFGRLEDASLLLPLVFRSGRGRRRN